jgi:hypothetical protein
MIRSGEEEVEKSSSQRFENVTGMWLGSGAPQPPSMG